MCRSLSAMFILNPVRAGICKNLAELENIPGAVIAGLQVIMKCHSRIRKQH